MQESSFVRQMSEKQGWQFTSNTWDINSTCKNNNINNNNNNNIMEGVVVGERRKRVMILVDESVHSKEAMLWALTHVSNKGDILTLLQVHITSTSLSNQLVTSLANLCKACKPEVQVEALVIQGPKLATVVNQVKKLEVSVLVLGQKNSSSFLRCFGGMSSTEKFVEECINRVECLTIGVKKQSGGVGGYLISTRWHKDFWLLA
ncbi:uncharacterized protein [Rutidosis leptorrhynchoides]|uniref:uncharacterized protein n=1 Tax=Rutidosis leptorrhynchoides TaxID=125765 RepID=UPI003A993A42